MCEMTDSTNSLDPLIDVHGDLDDLMLQHQTALLDQDIARARDAFEEFSRTIRKHIEIEDRMLLPVYQSRAGEPEGGATELFTSEHRKVEKYIRQLSDELASIEQEAELPKARLIRLIETEAQLKNLLEHHDRREQRFLYPLLAEHTTPEERADIWKRIDTVQSSS